MNNLHKILNNPHKEGSRTNTDRYILTRTVFQTKKLNLFANDCICFVYVMTTQNLNSKRQGPYRFFVLCRITVGNDRFKKLQS